VTREPHRNVDKGLILPSRFAAISPLKRSMMPEPSPNRMQSGRRMMALQRLVYQERRRALPSTTLRACLITTECVAVITELATPKLMPIKETDVPSRKTPTKKPSVTTEQATRMSSEGRVCRTKKDVATVKGRTRPRATW